MNIKRFLLLLFPLLCPFSFFLLFILPNERGLILLLPFVVCLAALGISLIILIKSIKQNWNGISLAGICMIIKLIHIPAYIAFFIMATALALTVLGLPFIFYFWFLDCIIIASTGIIGLASVILAHRQGIYKMSGSIWAIILQFIFCLDVVATVIFYMKLRKNKKALLLEEKTEEVTL